MARAKSLLEQLHHANVAMFIALLAFGWLVIGDSILGPVVVETFRVVDGSPATVIRGEGIKFVSKYDRLRDCATEWQIHLQSVTTGRRYIVPGSAHPSVSTTPVADAEFEQAYSTPRDIPPGWYAAVNTGTHRCMVFRKVEIFQSQEFEVL